MAPRRLALVLGCAHRRPKPQAGALPRLPFSCLMQRGL